ncbi:MAG: hypothetical protein KA745_11065, partial [Gemmatimonadales bacterium]|nr:hypothetical protein [Gemmatimonadales bacterium]
ALPIHCHAFRADERFYAFSCRRCVFVVDVDGRALVAELPMEEPSASVRFALDPTSEAVLVGNGCELVRRPFGGGAGEVLFAPRHRGCCRAPGTAEI